MANHSRYRRTRPTVIATIWQRFRTENMAQTSAALAFTTLLALVPLVTLVLSLGAVLPLFDTMIQKLDALVVKSLLPTGAAGTIADYVGRFSKKATRLTVPGLLMLGVTAFLLMHTIERTFNHLWQVKPRPLLARFKLYGLVITVWPFLLGAIAGAMSFAITSSLGFFDEPTWLRRVALKGLSTVLLGLFFAFLYYAVPNAKVVRRAALTGGAFAALAFALMQKAFELYLANFGALSTVYGAFAAVPIFLVWLQLSWAVILLGGLIAATAFRPKQR